jgi:UDP-glucose:(heptosyl)LPS alpha-1,3-glucosyltransferase
MHAQAAAMRGDTGQWQRFWRRLGKQGTLLTLEKKALAEARRIVSSSELMTRQLAAHYDLDAQRIVTLTTPRVDGESAAASADVSSAALAADRAWFRNHYRLGEKDRVALFVGHDFRRKGLGQAIEAIARTQDWKLVVVGLGRVKEYVELAQRLNLMPADQADAATPGTTPDPRVLFVGPTQELQAIYAAADALLLPAFYEPSGVVALEALGHGLPVISSAHLGVADLVLAYRAGAIVVDPQDVTGLAEALQNLPNTETADGKALAQRARSAAASLTPVAFADRLEKLYQEVARWK